MGQYALPCFVCQRPLLNIAHEAGGTGNQPSGGLEFSTPGHYGTTVFDPMDGSRLIIDVCDPCLSERMAYTKTNGPTEAAADGGTF